jgi:hypothetical protein
VGILTGTIGGQLDAVTAERPGSVDRLSHQGRADADAAVVGVHVHGLDLGAETAASLQVTEHDELADPHHLVAELGHQHGTGAILDLVKG